MNELNKVWPHAPARRGEYYTIKDPVFERELMVFMTNDTWTDFGTLHERYRRTCEKQDTRIKELSAENTALSVQLSDLRNQHEALRELRKQEKRAELNYLVPKI